MQRALIVLMFVASCAGCAGSGREAAGTGIGATLGGVIGNRLGPGGNKLVSTAGGAAIGGLIGNRVGKYLNDQDKRQTAEASKRTAETGQTQRVTTASGATLTTTPVPANSPKAAAPTPGAMPVASAQECKTVRQTIVLQDGTNESEDVTMCKGPDGWQPA